MREITNWLKTDWWKIVFIIITLPIVALGLLYWFNAKAGAGPGQASSDAWLGLFGALLGASVGGGATIYATNKSIQKTVKNAQDLWDAQRKAQQDDRDREEKEKSKIREREKHMLIYSLYKDICSIIETSVSEFSHYAIPISIDRSYRTFIVEILNKADIETLELFILMSEQVRLAKIYHSNEPSISGTMMSYLYLCIFGDDWYEKTKIYDNPAYSTIKKELKDDFLNVMEKLEEFIVVKKSG